MDYQYILIDVKDRIATVTINRPEYSNAFARESYYEIADAMNTLGARDDVGVIVITGAGKHFSAGGDIKRFKMLVDTKTYLKAEDIEAVSAMPISIRNCPKPVIAMINGVATGAGLSCALACDFKKSACLSHACCVFHDSPPAESLTISRVLSVWSRTYMICCARMIAAYAICI